MTPDDLRSLLDLGGKDAAPAAGDEGLDIQPAAAGASGQAGKTPSPTALALDRWGLRRGGQVLKDVPRLGQLLDLDNHETDREAAGLAAADFFGSALP